MINFLVKLFETSNTRQNKILMKQPLKILTTFSCPYKGIKTIQVSQYKQIIHKSLFQAFFFLIICKEYDIPLCLVKGNSSLLGHFTFHILSNSLYSSKFPLELKRADIKTAHSEKLRKKITTGLLVFYPLFEKSGDRMHAFLIYFFKPVSFFSGKIRVDKSVYLL